MTMKFSETFSSTTRTLINFDLYLPAVMIRYKGVVQIHSEVPVPRASSS